MPQEHHVLKCFSCGTFQAHIVKKSRKWECKLCGAKQSLKRNYGRGSAKDCRVHVMKLNELRLTKSSEQTEDEVLEGSTISLENLQEVTKGKEVGSKWDQFLEKDTNDSESDDDADVVSNLFFETEKKKKRTKKLNEDGPKNKKVCMQSSTSEIFSESREELFENEVFDTEISHIRTPENKFRKSKYEKYIDEEESKDEIKKVENFVNIFDSEPTDLDSILNFD